MSWIILIASGVLEAVWAVALSASDGLRKPKPAILFLVTVTASTVGLAFAMREIPTGTAYAVWVGVGATLTLVVSVLRGDETLGLKRALLLMLLVGCVIGLKVVS